MIFSRHVILFIALLTSSSVYSFVPVNYDHYDFSAIIQLSSTSSISSSRLFAVPGADIEQDVVVVDNNNNNNAKVMGGNAVFYRGQVNEIDYCIAPADVSLSRAYDQSNKNQQQQQNSSSKSSSLSSSANTLSMTRYLNNASNRAVRRILLALSWPSEEALNQSLRLAAAAEKEAAERAREVSASSLPFAGEGGSTAKCPIPRPLLNIIMRKDTGSSSSTTASSTATTSSSTTSTNPQKGRTNAQYVADQISAFQERYGALPGYEYAEAYLETILSLATSGEEPESVKDVMQSGVYDESYKRVRSVLKSVGVIFEEIPGTNDDRFRISRKLNNQDICLSMLDKIQMKQEQEHGTFPTPSSSPAPAPALQVVSTVESEMENGTTTETKKSNIEDIKPEVPTSPPKVEPIKKKKRPLLSRLKFWKRQKMEEPISSIDDVVDDSDDGAIAADTESDVDATATAVEDGKNSTTTSSSKPSVILLSAEEPTMTRQLNSLSNIVERALLFGGDQELLVLSETLFSNRVDFINRWYPGTGGVKENIMDKEETRPGVQYLNALILLLREAYENGVVTSLDPFTKIIPSYSNAYERLMATLVEQGSGYIRPEVKTTTTMTPISLTSSMPKPRTAKEELGRFAVWESNFRSLNAAAAGETASAATTYPDDLVGTWEVQDVVGGEKIGVSTVILEPLGEVYVPPPLQGLRWRLDPGPTHLDTCTFQVLSEDGTVLQYRGFIDRGARLESRFSGRSTKIRGSVMFQMRDGDVIRMGEDYWKDMLPINYKTGTTKFIMTKKVETEV